MPPRRSTPTPGAEIYLAKLFWFDLFHSTESAPPLTQRKRPGLDWRI
jgi:hypothetical protein